MVRAETAIALKADSTDMNKLVSQSTSAGDHITSATEHCKETGIAAKTPTHSETVPALTEQSLSIPSNKQPMPALHVATKREETPSLKPSLDENIGPPNNAGQHASQTNLHVKGAVTCPEDSLVLNQYGWKCELIVQLDRIQPLEIDIWSKKVRNYYVFSTPKEVTPIISGVKGYGLC